MSYLSLSSCFTLWSYFCVERMSAMQRLIPNAITNCPAYLSATLLLWVCLLEVFFPLEILSQSHSRQSHTFLTHTATHQELLQKAETYSTRQPTEAFRIALDAAAAALAKNDSVGYAEVLCVMGVLLRNQDLYDSAAKQQREALGIFERRGNMRGVATALLNLGGIYQSKAEYSQALESYLQALQRFTELGDSGGKARTLAGIGIIYRFKENYTKAMHYQQEALQLRINSGDKSSLAHSWRNIGGIYEEQKQSDSAFVSYFRALELFSQAADTQGIALTLGSLGNAYSTGGDYGKAMEYYFAAIPLQERLGDKRGQATLLNALARLSLRRDKPTQAILFAEKARIIADSIGAWGEHRDAYKVLAEAHSAMGNIDRAFEAYKRFTMLKDTIFSLQTLQKLVSLQANYDLAEKNRELQKVQHERDLEALRIRALWVGFGGGTFLLVVVIALLANGYRLKKNTAEKLQHQNIEIRQQQMLLEQQAMQIQQANDALQMSNALLEERNKALVEVNGEKNEFLGIAAHDLKNPLNAILLTSELIPEYLDRQNSEKIKEFSSSIRVAANTMLGIITNLLDVNRIEAGKVVLAAEAVALHPIMALLLDRYTFAAEQKNIVLKADPFPPNVVAKGDVQAIEQIVDNLLSNAVKYSPLGKSVMVRMGIEKQQENSEENPEKDTTEITDSQEQLAKTVLEVSSVKGQSLAQSFIRIEIQDEGPGLSEADKKKLFGKFARLSAQPTGGEHSTGLGLSIVKKMVEAMNGRVWCESELGKGATFIVVLPTFEE